MRKAEQNAALPSAEKVELEAAKWLARIDSHYGDRNVCLDDYASHNIEFSNWLEKSITNRVALLRLLSIWKRTGRMSALKSPNSKPEIKKVNSQPDDGLNYKRIGGFLAAACLLIVLLIGFRTYESGQDAITYQTAKGGHEVVPLIDGSKVELNSDTKFTVQMAKNERVIMLDRGEAFFEVSHDANRPFRIIAGDHTVTVLGTKFAVYRNAGEIEVAVTEGRVAIGEGTSKNAAPQTVILPGDIAKTEHGTLLVLNKGLDAVERELSWRHGYIVLDKRTLKEAAEEFSRYHKVEFVIKDQKIARMLVSGRFKSDNLEGFLRLLEEGFGFHISRLNDKISIEA